MTHRNHRISAALGLRALGQRNLSALQDAGYPASTLSMGLLANELVKRTLKQRGTNELFVNRALKAAHDAGEVGGLDYELKVHLKSQGLGPKPGANGAIHALLERELSGADLQRARELLEHGRELGQASAFAYLADGAISVVEAPVDSFEAKPVRTVIGLGLGLMAAPVVAAFGLGYGVGRAARGGFDYAFAKDSQAEAQALVKVGEGAATALLSGVVGRVP